MSSSGPRPFILATNDDGFDAPGLASLVEACVDWADLLVVAPDREQSGASHSLTLKRPLRAFRVAPDRYRVDGTPTDCVHLAVYSLTRGRAPDLLLSGINRGLNVGDDVTYSGTVAGALEGALLGIPALALSAETDETGQANFPRAGALIRDLATGVLRDGLERGVLLNVNFPHGAAHGVRLTRQGSRVYRATALERIDPSGVPYYWIAGSDATPTGEPDGDHVAIRDGFVSITPLHANMTHEPSMHSLAGRVWTRSELE